MLVFIISAGVAEEGHQRTSEGKEQSTKVFDPAFVSGIPCPASTYCSKLGYKNEVHSDENGQYGIAIFPDGTRCEEWTFFRGKCGQKWSYCEQQGGKIENRIENMGTWSAEYAVCVFSDRSECDEFGYFEGQCKPRMFRKWSIDKNKRVKFNTTSPSPQ